MKEVHLRVEKGSKAYLLFDPNTWLSELVKMYNSRKISHGIGGKPSKIQTNPSVIFTIEGYTKKEYQVHEDMQCDTPKTDTTSLESQHNSHGSTQSTPSSSTNEHTYDSTSFTSTISNEFFEVSLFG